MPTCRGLGRLVPHVPEPGVPPPAHVQAEAAMLALMAPKLGPNECWEKPVGNSE